MKKLLLILTLCFSFSFISAQKTNIDLILKAYFQGRPSTFDSVSVTNLIHPGSIMMYYPDTILSNYTTGINNYENEDGLFELRQNYPNPYAEQCAFELLTNDDEEVTFYITDILGRTEYIKSFHLSPGEHSFNIETGNIGIHFLTARTNRYNRSIKLVQTGSNYSYDITYTGSKDFSLNSSKGNSPEKSYFDFDTGDHFDVKFYKWIGDSDGIEILCEAFPRIDESGSIISLYLSDTISESISLKNTTWEVLFSRYTAYNMVYVPEITEEDLVEATVTFYDSTFLSFRIKDISSLYYKAWEFGEVCRPYWGKYKLDGSLLKIYSINSTLSDTPIRTFGFIPGLNDYFNVIYFHSVSSFRRKY